MAREGAAVAKSPEAGDYLMAQLTDYSGAGGYDGITVDAHFT